METEEIVMLRIRISSRKSRSAINSLNGELRCPGEGGRFGLSRRPGHPRVLLLWNADYSACQKYIRGGSNGPKKFATPGAAENEIEQF